MSAASAEAHDPTVAVMGLGAMGLPMARCLTRRFQVRGFDVDAGRRELLEQDGAVARARAAQAVDAAQVVVLAVRTLAQATDCLFGAGNAAASLADGAVVVLTSTVGAEGARSLAARLAALGAELVDAPVSGGPVRAGNGDLLILASGSEASVEVAKPVLDTLASTLVVVGSGAGDGQSMKIVNQLLCGVHIAAAAEALVLAKALGIEPEAALAAIGSGAAASFMLGDRGPRIAEQLAGKQPEIRSRLDIFVKDMGLVAEAAAQSDLSLPVSAAAQDLFRLGEEHGLAAGDDSGIALIIDGGSR